MVVPVITTGSRSAQPKTFNAAITVHEMSTSGSKAQIDLSLDHTNVLVPTDLSAKADGVKVDEKFDEPPAVADVADVADSASQIV